VRLASDRRGAGWLGVLGSGHAAEACLKWAMESGQSSGIWGGLSQDDRHAGRTADLPIFRTSRGVRGVRPRMDSCSAEGPWVLSCPPCTRLVLANPLAGLVGPPRLLKNSMAKSGLTKHSDGGSEQVGG
jgi:Transcription factor WhiB